jgi:DNA-binding response OmpR family regulator
MSGWKILLVDDEEDFISTLAERLDMRGMHTETAYSGEEALRRLNENPPEIVVMDVMMPGMNGLECLRRIRSTQPDIPVILLTGIGSTEEGVQGMELGAADYLMKPLQIEDLIAKIGEALQKAPGGHS